MEPYLNVFIDSVQRMCRFVSEVIVVKSDETTTGLIREWRAGNIAVKLYGMALPKFNMPECWIEAVCGHALGMHQAIDLASRKYVWLCDPDTFLLTSLDEFYLKLMDKYNLDCIGVSHFNEAEQSYGDFPCAINYLTERSKLPPPNWLKGQLSVQSAMRVSDNPSPVMKMDGKYLLPGPIHGFSQVFTNPEGIFDMGCNLWLWNHQQNGRWLSFQMGHYADCFKDNFGLKDIAVPANYSAKHFRSNIQISDDMGNTELLYHRTRGARERGASFTKLYKDLFPNTELQGPRVNYVIGTWSGKRLVGYRDTYLLRHLKHLNKIKHSLAQISVGYPYNPSEKKWYANFIKSLKSLSDGTPIVVHPMPNKGLSYGQWSNVFGVYRDQFTHYIFIEDDYVPQKDFFDEILVSMFESLQSKNCGYLCGLVFTKEGRFGGLKEDHAGISNGVSSAAVLNKVWGKYGCLPHLKTHLKAGREEEQVIFSKAFLNVGFTLHDYLPKFRSLYESHKPDRYTLYWDGIHGEDLICPVSYVDKLTNMKIVERHENDPCEHPVKPRKRSRDPQPIVVVPEPPVNSRNRSVNSAVVGKRRTLYAKSRLR